MACVGEQFADVNVVNRVPHGGVMVWAQHICILLMTILMHRDIVTRFWGPLSCHSSAAINSCFSMIMHSPMLQGSVHNFWKLKMSQFLPDLHTRHTRHVTYIPCLGCSGYPATSHSHWRGVGQYSTGQNQQPDQLYVKEMCRAAWDKWWLHQILTGFLIHGIWYLWPIDAYLYSQSREIHRLWAN